VAGCDAIIAPLFMADTYPTSTEQASLLVQKVRGALRNADKRCYVLSTAEPYFKCGGSPTGAPFNRADIFCEMMLWQSEQLGDGDQAEYARNGCPWGGVADFQDKRHQGALDQENIPTWRKSRKTAPATSA